MQIGKVIGSMQTRNMAQGMQTQKVVLVHAGEENIAAVDHAGAKTGEKVLLVTGSVAERYCMDAPVDAVVVAVIDENVHGSDIPMRSPDKSSEQTWAEAGKPL